MRLPRSTLAKGARLKAGRPVSGAALPPATAARSDLDWSVAITCTPIARPLMWKSWPGSSTRPWFDMVEVARLKSMTARHTPAPAADDVVDGSRQCPPSWLSSVSSLGHHTGTRCLPGQTDHLAVIAFEAGPVVLSPVPNAMKTRWRDCTQLAERTVITRLTPRGSAQLGRKCCAVEAAADRHAIAVNAVGMLDGRAQVGPVVDQLDDILRTSSR